MKVGRIVSLLLVVSVLISSLSITAFSADNKWKPKNDCPIIFVHGLNGWGGSEGMDKVVPYWGATTGDIIPYLQNQGYECYSASAGPLSSAWDRACELYASILGTTVDYGVAHSAENGHDRFGRTYHTALVPNWGSLDQSGKIKQVHLVGHSFGGMAVRMLVELLTNGSREEIAATDQNDISGLFTGGKGNWVLSVTTICTPHQSSTAFYVLEALNLVDIVWNISFLYAGVVGRTFLNGGLVDFHLEQFGLTDIPGGEKSDPLIPALMNLYSHREDTCHYDLTPKGCSELNEKLSLNENVYYFSYAFSTTKEVPVVETQIPMLKTNPIIAPLALVMGMLRFEDKENGIYYGTEWLANDALVNVESAKHPANEAYCDYNSESVTTGIWNVMPVREGDHGTAIGLFGNRDETRAFFLEHCEMITALESR